jgi:hypothetical protein
VRSELRKYAALIGIALAVFMGLRAAAQTGPDEKLFQDARILLFDEKWDAARQKLEELLRQYPASSLTHQAQFYRAKCLAKQEGDEKDALAAYEEYLTGRDMNPSLTEEADTSIIDLAYDLYTRGERSYLAKIEERLDSSDRVVKYYAAFKLSSIKDKSAAKRAVPVLRGIVEEERDPDLRDRARIALLRVSPAALKQVEDSEEPSGGRLLKIRVTVRGQREPEIALNLPWALADLALRAIPEKDRAALRAQGYDLDKIIDDLARRKESIIEIRGEGRIIKIWIE